MKTIKNFIFAITLFCMLPVQQTQAIILDFTTEAFVLAGSAVAYLFCQNYRYAAYLKEREELKKQQEKEKEKLAALKQQERDEYRAGSSPALFIDLMKLRVACRSHNIEEVRDLIYVKEINPYQKPTQNQKSAYEIMTSIKKPTQEQLLVITILETSPYENPYVE